MSDGDWLVLLVFAVEMFFVGWSALRWLVGLVGRSLSRSLHDDYYATQARKKTRPR